MSAWSPLRVSNIVAAILLIATTVGAADRLRPAPGSEPEVWARHAVEDESWARQWPADWALDERPAAMPVDTLRLRLRRLLAEQQEGAGHTGWSDRLRGRWHRRGHLACSVTLVDGDTSYLEVDPGPRYRLGRLAVEGLDRLGDPERLRTYLPEPGEPFDAVAWERGVSALLEAAGDAGRPFATWTVREVGLRTEGAWIDVKAALGPGDPMVVGRIASSLPPGPGHRFLVRASGLRPGEPFRQSRLDAARTRLQARGLYRFVEEPVVFVTAAQGSVGVYWPVVPLPKPNRFAVVLGLSRPGDGEKTRLSGQVDLRMGNIAGTGRSLDLAWSDDGGDRSRFGFQWLEPLVVGTPLDLEVAVDQEVVADVHTRIRLDGSVLLPVAGTWGISLGLGRDRVSYPNGAWSRSSRWRSRGAMVHHRGDRARSGWSGTFAVESAHRSVDLRDEADPDATANLQELRQTLVELDLDGELWLARAVSLGVRGRFADVSGAEGAIPLVEQYRLGGARSLRGYREDAYHGERVASAAFELRLGRAGRSRVYSFLDLGYVRLTSDDPAGDGVLRNVERPYGFGLGLETASPGGDVSLAVGFPGTIDFDVAKLHVSLIQAF